MCKKIHRGGNAEQYHADKKYKEAVAAAVEACADDTKGQTCFICTQALHWKTKEGLVRGCACRGTAGFAHVSCLAEQAKLLVAEAEENNWDDDRFMLRWERWYNCSLCEQHYHGVVRCALGWACWKTYLGRPETDLVRQMAISVLGNGLFETNRYEDASSVMEADLSTMRRLGESSEDVILVVQSSLAITYSDLGRLEEALRMKREVYSGRLKLFGEESPYTLQAAINYAISLVNLRRDEEAKALLRKTIPVARRVLGESDQLTLRMRWIYAKALCRDDSAIGDLREAVTMLEDTVRIARRVLGGAHPITGSIQSSLVRSRAILRDRETPPTSA